VWGEEKCIDKNKKEKDEKNYDYFDNYIDMMQMEPIN